MKKLFLIICTITTSSIFTSEGRSILLCPLQLLDESSDIHHYTPHTIPEALEHVSVNDSLVFLCRLMQGVVTLSTQPHNAARVGAEVAALIAELMATTTAVAKHHNLTGTSSLAQICRSMQADTKRPRPKLDLDPEEVQERVRIRDVIIASFVNILSNVAVITAHPHDHKLVASHATLLAANILNAVKETVRSPAHEDYENFAQQLTAMIVHEYA